MEADAFASEIRLQLALLAAPPPSLSGLEKVSYVFVLDTDGDVGPEYSINFETRDDGSYAASLDDHLGGYRYEGSEFPGSILFQERVVFVQLALSSLGSPTNMKVCAVTRATGPNGTVAAEDNVPDGVCLNGEQMLTLR